MRWYHVQYSFIILFFVWREFFFDYLLIYFIYFIYFIFDSQLSFDCFIDRCSSLLVSILSHFFFFFFFFGECDLTGKRKRDSLQLFYFVLYLQEDCEKKMDGKEEEEKKITILWNQRGD